MCRKNHRWFRTLRQLSLRSRQLLRTKTMGRRSTTAASTTGPSPRSRKTVAKVVPPVDKGLVVKSWTRSAGEFVATTLASLGLSTVLFSLSVPITQGDLAWTSKHLDSWVYVAALLGWRILEIGAAWMLEFDGWFSPVPLFKDCRGVGDSADISLCSSRRYELCRSY